MSAKFHSERGGGGAKPFSAISLCFVVTEVISLRLIQK